MPEQEGQIPKEARLIEIITQLDTARLEQIKEIAALLKTSPEQGVSAMAQLQEQLGQEADALPDNTERILGLIKMIFLTAITYALAENYEQSTRELADALMYFEYDISKSDHPKLIGLIRELESLIANH